MTRRKWFGAMVGMAGGAVAGGATEKQRMLALVRQDMADMEIMRQRLMGAFRDTVDRQAAQVVFAGFTPSNVPSGFIGKP